MNWTPEARESARRAHPEYGDAVLVATVKHAEKIARRGRYNIVDTDIWFQALLDVWLPPLKREHETSA